MDEEELGLEETTERILTPKEEIDLLTMELMAIINEINERKDGFNIDIKRLSDDAMELANILANKPAIRDLKLDLNKYEALNELLKSLTSLGYDTELIFDKLYEYYPNLDFYLNKNEYVEEIASLKPMFENEELIRKTFSNYRRILNESGYIHLPFEEKLRKYSPKDFKDIILSYYATYDDRIYKIAKRYFDERRIEVNTKEKTPPTDYKKLSVAEAREEVKRLKGLIKALMQKGTPTKEDIRLANEYGCIVNSLEKQIKDGEKTLNKSKYVNLLRKLIRKTEREIDLLLLKDKLTSEETIRLKELDELLKDYNEELKSIYSAKIEDDGVGYYYSASSIESGYIYSEGPYNSFTAAVVAHELGHAMEAELYDFPQQKNFIIGPYYETSSQAFETGFENYLIDQKIDEVGGLLIKNSDYNDLLDRTKRVEKELSKGMKLNPKRKLVTAKDGRVLNVTPFLYGFGKYYAEHLAKIQRENPSEFFKIYNNFISYNHMVSMEELISYLGISTDEFASGEIIEPTIKKDTKELQRILFKK